MTEAPPADTVSFETTPLDVPTPPQAGAEHEGAPTEPVGPDPVAPPENATAEEDHESQALHRELTALRAGVEALVMEGRAATARAEARERVIEHLREDNDRLKAERRGTHLRPLVVDLQKLRAELLADVAAGSTSGTAPGHFAHYAATVGATLERCGMQPVPLVVGDEFAADRHAIVRTVPVGPENHGTVVEILTEGWAETDSGRVLAPAKVVVGRHQEQERSDV